MNRTAILSLALLIPGCAAKVLQATLTPADVEAATVALEPGTGTIKGSALLRQQGGGVVTCAGSQVVLVPATESAAREFTRIFGGDKGFLRAGSTRIVLPDPSRQGVCNAQGFFTFDKVRAGRWHVLTSVVWTVGYATQGGMLLTTADVSETGETEVVLTF